MPVEQWGRVHRHRWGISFRSGVQCAQWTLTCWVQWAKKRDEWHSAEASHSLASRRACQHGARYSCAHSLHSHLDQSVSSRAKAPSVCLYDTAVETDCPVEDGSPRGHVHVPSLTSWQALGSFFSSTPPPPPSSSSASYRLFHQLINKHHCWQAALMSCRFGAEICRELGQRRLRRCSGAVVSIRFQLW